MNQREIAKLANVSSATVSRVINNDPKVAPETYRKVKAVIEQQGYVENGMARNLKMSKTHTVGYLISNIFNPFFQSVYAGIEKVCKKNQYQIIIGSTNEDIESEKNAIDLFLTYRVDGLIASFVNPDEIIRRKLTKLNVPVVLLDRKVDSISGDRVMIDNISGAVNQVQYLAGLGHRKIAVIYGTLYNSPGVERLDGFYRGMETSGLKVQADYVVSGDFTEEGGYRAARYLMELPAPPTAVIVHNNLMSIGAYKLMKDKKIRIPEEVSVIGFDDFDLAVHLSPQLTLIQRPMEEMGIVAMEMLLDRLNAPHGQAEYRTKEFPTNLCVRESCGPPGL